MARPGRLHHVADADAARQRTLLQARGDVGGVADGGVVHAQVVADAPHHHRARVQTHAHPHRSEQFRRVGRGFLQPLADGQCAVQGAAHVVFVGQRRAEQRHEAVTQELVDRAFDPVHLGHGQREERVERVVHGLGTDLLRQFGRVGEVAEQHRDLLAFAFQCRARGQDLLGQVRWRVRAWLPGGAVGQSGAAGVAEAVGQSGWRDRRLRRCRPVPYRSRRRSGPAPGCRVHKVRTASKPLGTAVPVDVPACLLTTRPCAPARPPGACYRGCNEIQ
jgi:hypothetical protein